MWFCRGGKGGCAVQVLAAAFGTEESEEESKPKVTNRKPGPGRPRNPVKAVPEKIPVDDAFAKLLEGESR